MPEEERHDDPEQEEPENEGAMTLLEAQQEAQDTRDARVLQTEEKDVTDTAVDEVTEDRKNMSVEEVPDWLRPRGETDMIMVRTWPNVAEIVSHFGRVVKTIYKAKFIR
eukprot:g3339.t1